MQRFVITASIAVLAAACSVTDYVVEPDAPDAPAAWASRPEAAAPPRGDWLAAFDDAALTGLVIEAIENNYDLAAAAARFEQAEALARTAGAARFPTLDGTSSASRTERNLGLDVDSFGLGLSASWEADLWGRLSDRAQAGELDALASEADLADVRLSIAGGVARAWYDLIEARLLAALAADDVATQEGSLRLTRRRFDSGVSSAVDVRLARSSVASAEATLVQQLNAVNAAARRVEVLLGRYPSAELGGANDLPALESLVGVGAPGDLLSRRPDLRAAEARLYAAGLRVSEARAALLPRLTLTGTTGTNGPEFEDIFDGDFLTSTIAASLLQPIFRGGALRAEADRNEAVARERLAAYANAALAAYQEAENALDADLALAEQVARLTTAVEEALAAEASVELDYARGQRTIFELLDAQRRRISAQRSLITARAQRVDNRVQLHLAIGGAFLTDYAPRNGAVALNAPGE